MPQADTARCQVYYAEESTWGVTPSGPAPSLKPIRFTGESLGHNKNTVESQEIRADSQVTDYSEVGVDAGGDVNIEWSYGAYDDLIQAALRSTWQTVANENISCTFANPENTISGTGIGANVVPGIWIRVSGGPVANAGYFLVDSATENQITVSSLTPIPADEGPVTADVHGDYIRNGTVKKSFTLEKVFSDLSAGHFHSFPGCRVNNLSANLTADQILTGVINFMGKEGIVADATVGDGTPDAAATGEVLNATSNVGLVFEGTSPLTTALQSVEISLTNNLRSQRAIGSRGAIGIGYGRFRVSGSINAYFENGTLYSKMISHATSALAFRVHEDPSAPKTSKAYMWYMPRVKFGGGNPQAPATDQDAFINLEYMALRDATLGFTLQMSRFPANP